MKDNKTSPSGDKGPQKIDALGETVEVVEQGTGKWVLNPDKNPLGTTTVLTDTHVLADVLGGNFKISLFDGPRYTPLLRDTQREMVGMWMPRCDLNADKSLPAAPAHADDLLDPAFQCIQENSGLINAIDPMLLKDEDMGKLAATQQKIADSRVILQTFSPIIQGATVAKVTAQVDLSAFCKRFYDSGGDRLMGKNFVLHENLKPLSTLVSAQTTAALETKQLIAQTRHETEAQTLDRVKQAIASQGNAPGTTAPAPVQGAHAPGQNPVPAGALPVLTVLPVPQHPKPKRRVPAGKKPTSGSTPPSTKGK